MSHTLIIFISSTPLQLSKNISFQLGSRQITDLIVVGGWGRTFQQVLFISEEWDWCFLGGNLQQFGVCIFFFRCISIFFVEFQAYFGQDYARTAWIHSIVDCATMLCGVYCVFTSSMIAFSSAPSVLGAPISQCSRLGRMDAVDSQRSGVSEPFPLV